MKTEFHMEYKIGRVGGKRDSDWELIDGFHPGSRVKFEFKPPPEDKVTQMHD